MDNELSRIGDTISDTISNFLIDDDYKIDDTLEWSDLIQVYIMRYRRIIGILILVMLLGIMRYCSWKEDIDSDMDSDRVKKFGLQTGGGNHSAAVDAEMAKLRAVDAAQTKFAKEKAEAVEQKGKADQAEKLATVKAAKNASRSKFSKKMDKLGDTLKSTKLGKKVSSAAASIGSAAASIGSAGQAVGDKLGSAGSHLAKETYTGDQVSKLKSAAGNALGKTKLGKFASGTMGDIATMKSLGMSKAGIAKELAGQAGQYAVDKFKEFSGWLYEILFALAISIAICMIVVPSIAFFALGLICYFLLRKKISSMKAF